MRRRNADRGQALVEFAIVIPVFMLLLAGTIQLGVILWASNTLNQVVRDTGRFAATVCGSSGVSATTTAFTRIYGDSSGPWDNPVLVPPDYFPDPDNALNPPPKTDCPDENSAVSWVTVAASMDAFVFFPWLPGDGLVSSSVTFRVEPAP